MFERTFRVSVPAGATSVALPLGVDRNALLEITDITNPGVKPPTKRNADGSLSITASGAARTLQVGVLQSNPLIATHGAVPDWAAQTEYFKDELVFWMGRIYRAKANIVRGGSGWSLSYPQASQWENTSGDTGHIVDFMAKQPLLNGYWPCDGSVINAPWSPLHGATTPDMRGRVLAGEDLAKGYGYGASGTEAFELSTAHLPRVPIAVTVDGASAGKPTGRGNAQPAGQHSHVLYSCGSGTGEYIDHNTSGSSTGLQSYMNSISSEGNHSHDVIFTGDTMPAHTHTGSVVLNTLPSQLAISARQPTYSVSRFVRL